MSDRDLPARIVDQFSYESDRADAWTAFEVVLATDRFLNLGYSRWYQTHLLGDPQRRLVDRAVRELEAEREDAGSTPNSRRLLDVGCGRGGPATYLATEYGYEVVGIDLVPYNVALARENASATDPAPEFVLGDATRLPFGSAAVPAITALDAIVYVPDKVRVFEDIERVLQPEGACVITDLVAEEGVDPTAPALRRFADAWDMPPLWPVEDYRGAVQEAGLERTREVDLSSNSVRGFRKWTTRYLRVVDSRLAPVLHRLLGRLGLDPEVVTEQVRTAHEALPALRHELLVLT